jgi:hypothetical protein
MIFTLCQLRTTMFNNQGQEACAGIIAKDWNPVLITGQLISFHLVNRSPKGSGIILSGPSQFIPFSPFFLIIILYIIIFYICFIFISKFDTDFQCFNYGCISVLYFGGRLTYFSHQKNSKK